MILPEEECYNNGVFWQAIDVLASERFTSLSKTPFVTPQNMVGIPWNTITLITYRALES
jgi:hypothetical protein